MSGTSLVVLRVVTSGLFLASTFLLAYRLRKAWAYAGSRWLLIALSVLVPLLAAGFGQAIAVHARPGPITYLWPVAGAFLFGVCLVWPDGRRQAHLAERIRRGGDDEA